MPIDLNNDSENKTRSSRSRKKSNSRIEINPKAEGSELKSWVCRKCLRRRPLKDYYITTDPEWDSSGKYSICRFCIEDAYERYFLADKSIDKVIYRLCKILNTKFDSSALETAKKNIETLELRGRPITSVFGIYRKSLVVSSGRAGFNADNDLTYKEGVKYDAPPLDPDEYEGGEATIIQLESFWGKGFEAEEYQFLEERLSEWKSSYTCQNKSEEFYLKEACFKELDLKKARLAGTGVDSILKSMNELLKNAALTPAQTSAADSGKMHDTWGTIIKKIEETSPAEYYKDKKLFKDFDGIERKYILPYIVRSIKNFILNSRDFNIVEDDNDKNIFEEIDGYDNESSPLSIE